jgi:ABC-type uncharacterized transport system involved in gliding motility auxiliary subunit
MKQKNLQTILYSTAGVVAMLIALLAFYVVSGAVKQRVDLTAEKSYTLSKGTKDILGKLNKRVTIRYYCTQGDAMPVSLKTYARRIEDLLSEYRQNGHGKIVVENYDPTPDSDAEESATLNGVEGQATSPYGGDKVYLGLVVSILNEKIAIPWLDPQREKLLEYDLSRAIARVQNPEPPVLGVMSAMPVFGQPAPMSMMMRRNQQAGSEPWVFISELKKDYTLREIPMTAAKIDDDIKVLVIIHPRDISDATQYAIDQFILRGGKVLAMVDPHAYFDQKQDQMAQVLGESSGQSSMDKLFRAWGIDMDISKVAADVNFGMRNPNAGLQPTVLILTSKGINSDDAVTSQIDNVVLPFAGVFTGKPVDGLKETVLLNTTGDSELIDGMLSSVGTDNIIKEFKASKTNYPLAIRLTGKFKTAFPDGKPADKKDSNKSEPKDTTPAVDDKQLKESITDGAVVLIADSDLINDKVAVQVQDILGYRVVQMANGNLNFVQSLVEQLSGDNNLITLRSRASMNRPFTRVREMQANAEKQYQSKIKDLEGSLADTQRRLNELQASKQGDSQQKLILSADQQKELDKFREKQAQTKKDLKELRKNLRKDTDQMEFWTKVVNIAAVPALVAITGLALGIMKRKKTAAK